MYILNFRQNGSIGRPTVRIIAHTTNDALNRALEEQLEFIPYGLAEPDKIIFIPDTNDHGYEVEELEMHHRQAGTKFTTLFWGDVAALRDAFGMVD